jgi:hypothetical protein
MSSINKYKNINLEFTDIDKNLKQEPDQEKHPLLPNQNNFRQIVCGSSGSGKTSYVCQYITRFMKVRKLYILAKHLNQPKMEYLINFYKEMERELSKKLKKDIQIVEIVTNDIDEFPTVDNITGKDNVIVIDDFVMEPDKQNKLPNYFVRGRHHGCSIFYLSQTFFAIPRKIRLNSNLFSIFNMLSLTETTRIHREVGSDLDKQEFLKAIRYATKEPYQFFFVDTTQTKKLLKYRKNLDEVIPFD